MLKGPKVTLEGLRVIRGLGAAVTVMETGCTETFVPIVAVTLKLVVPPGAVGAMLKVTLPDEVG